MKRRQRAAQDVVGVEPIAKRLRRQIRDDFLPDEMWGEVLALCSMRDQLLIVARLSRRFLRLVTPLRAIDTIELTNDKWAQMFCYSDGYVCDVISFPSSTEARYSCRRSVLAKLTRLFRPHSLVSIGNLTFSEWRPPFHDNATSAVMEWALESQTRLRHLTVTCMYSENSTMYYDYYPVISRLPSLTLHSGQRLDDSMSAIGLSTAALPNLHTLEISKPDSMWLFRTDVIWITKYAPNLRCLTLRKPRFVTPALEILTQITELNILADVHTDARTGSSDTTCRGFMRLLCYLPRSLMTLRITVSIHVVERSFWRECAKVIKVAMPTICTVDLTIRGHWRLQMTRANLDTPFEITKTTHAIMGPAT